MTSRRTAYSVVLVLADELRRANGRSGVCDILADPMYTFSILGKGDRAEFFVQRTCISQSLSNEVRDIRLVQSYTDSDV